MTSSNRDRAVMEAGRRTGLAGPSPEGESAGGPGLMLRATRTHASQARDCTPSRPVVLQGRGRRSAQSIREINAEPDPFRALARASEYLTSVLRPAGRRNLPQAAGWCWAAVHVIDALAAAIERGEQPHPWFRDHRSWRLNPAGWAPLTPVTQTFRTLRHRPGREESR